MILSDVKEVSIVCFLVYWFVCCIVIILGIIVLVYGDVGIDVIL